MKNIAQNKKIIDSLGRIYDRFTQLAPAKRQRLVEKAKEIARSENDVVLKECFQLFADLLQDFNQVTTESENEK